MMARALLLILVVLAANQASAVLYGTYTADNVTFLDLNIWSNWNNSKEFHMQQSVELINIGWAPVEKIPEQLKAVHNVWDDHQAVPVITWMPYPYATWTNPRPCKDIANGEYDTYIKTFVVGLSNFLKGDDMRFGTKDDRRERILCLQPQPNGDWFPWSPQCPSCTGTGQHINQSPEDYRDMWNYVMWFVRDEEYGMTPAVLQIMFVANNVDAVNENYKVEDFFPLKELNWLGVTGMNWGDTLPGNEWLTATQVFSRMVTRLNRLNLTLPMSITAASTTHPRGTWDKESWILGLATYVASSKSKMMIYQNSDSSTDFAMFGGSAGTHTWRSFMSSNTYNVYPTFAYAVHQPEYGYVGTNTSLPRLITDKDFEGK